VTCQTSQTDYSGSTGGSGSAKEDKLIKIFYADHAWILVEFNLIYGIRHLTFWSMASDIQIPLIKGGG
jgi:hypothetical protein